MEARRSHRQVATQSQSPKPEERGLRNEKASVHHNYAANLGKTTSATSLPPALTKDRKYPSLESVRCSPSKSLVKDELMSYEKKSRRFEPLKPSSSAETLNSDAALQKRPIKLAPLNLPEEVKQAQLKKMKDEVYLATRSNKTTDKMVKTLNDRPAKREPFNRVGMGDDNLEKNKVENILSKDSKGLQDSIPNVGPLFGNTCEGKSISSITKFKSGQVHHSVSKTVTADSTNLSPKGRASYPKSHKSHHTKTSESQ